MTGIKFETAGETLNTVALAETSYVMTVSSEPIVGIEKEPILLPAKFKLFQNYPNPFNPSTVIKYEIPKRTRNNNMFVVLKVFDLLGKEVAVLVNEEKPAGVYEVSFDGKNLTSGVYLYQLETDSYIETKKMILLR